MSQDTSDQTGTPPANSPNVQDRLTRIEEFLYENVEERVNHPVFFRNLLYVCIIASVCWLGWWGIKLISKPPARRPIVEKIHQIRQLGELHLVKHHSNSIIPVYKDQKKDKKKLRLVMVSPAVVSGYINLDELKTEILPDSMIKIHLPQPQVSKVQLDYRNTEELPISETWLDFENIQWGKAFGQIQLGIGDAQDSVRARAIRMNIEGDVWKQAEAFLKTQVEMVGYQPIFVRPESTPKFGQGALKAEISRLLDQENLSGEDQKVLKLLLKQLVK
ncbi:DUF4230 domain-containing protein [Pontibacter sp. G13]|uniref:DUF4230 domain-containing protein n=1 Tax=Pontibacter sp. G13 TaxID=3074898 RepID=UPI00288C4F67|nr:DUF4230 domain-containing protein [Pontibacter sp. G13]WNJ17332.1 DUF4230 domain-containing protein [Pontibacter sp. G13]